jgi:two-component system, response regulator PdtaR
VNKNDLNVLIIEDDLVQAEGLKENLIELGYDRVFVTSTLAQVKKVVDKADINIILADIDLGKNETLQGPDIVTKLKLGDDAAVIYLSSYDEVHYRNKVYDSGGLFYLTKPVSKKQIDVAIDFAMRQKFDKGNNNPTHGSCPLFASRDHIFVKVKDRFEKIIIKDIIYLEADSSYCTIYTYDKKHHISTSLNHVLEQSKVPSLVRCHRSFAVNVDRIQSFDESQLFMPAQNTVHVVNIGNSYKEEVMGRLFRVKAE